MRAPFWFESGKRGTPLGASLLPILGVLLALVAAPAASADGVPLNTEDVLAGVGGGITKHFNPGGELLDELNNQTASTFDTGMCFDAQGNLYATDFEGMSKFDAGGNLLTANF